jgi:hypothetical protein
MSSGSPASSGLPHCSPGRSDVCRTRRAVSACIGPPSQPRLFSRIGAFLTEVGLPPAFAEVEPLPPPVELPDSGTVARAVASLPHPFALSRVTGSSMLVGRRMIAPQTSWQHTAAIGSVCHRTGVVVAYARSIGRARTVGRGPRTVYEAVSSGLSCAQCGRALSPGDRFTTEQAMRKGKFRLVQICTWCEHLAERPSGRSGLPFHISPPGIPSVNQSPRP